MHARPTDFGGPQLGDRPTAIDRIEAGGRIIKIIIIMYYSTPNHINRVTL